MKPPYLRLMQPLYTEESCLKCPAFQGYKVGDLRGGVSLSLPMTACFEARRGSRLGSLVSHGLIWLAGVIEVDNREGGAEFSVTLPLREEKT